MPCRTAQKNHMDLRWNNHYCQVHCQPGAAGNAGSGVVAILGCLCIVLGLEPNSWRGAGLSPFPKLPSGGCEDIDEPWLSAAVLEFSLKKENVASILLRLGKRKALTGVCLCSIQPS